MGPRLTIWLVIAGVVILYVVARLLSGRRRLPRVKSDFSTRHVHYRQGVTDSSYDSGGPDSHVQTFRSLAEMPDELRRNVGEALHGRSVEGRTAIDPDLARQDFDERRKHSDQQE